jgi:hypothetical protein
MAALATLVVVVAAAPGFESSASALICGSVRVPADPYAAHRVVVDGVVLSGPANPGFQRSEPARFLVTRWIRGSGPRVLRVKTGSLLVPAIDRGLVSLQFDAHAGQALRLFSYRAYDGLLIPDVCAEGEDPPPRRLPLTSSARLTARAATPGDEFAWTARASRGPFGLHCVRTAAVGDALTARDECDAGQPILAVHHRLSGPIAVESTAVTVAGPGVAGARLDTPDGPLPLRQRVPGRPLLAVLRGHVVAAQIRARLTMTDGSVRWLRPVGFPAEVWPDPQGGRPFYTLLQRRTNGACVDAAQLPDRYDPNVDPLWVNISPRCDTFGRDGFFYEFTFTSLPRPGPEQAQRKLVFGAADPAIRTITIRRGSGVRRIVPGLGGQFAAIYPESVRERDLTIRAHR